MDTTPTEIDDFGQPETVGPLNPGLNGHEGPLDEAGARKLLERASGMSGMWTLAVVLVIAATSLYLLERLEPVLRPLFIAHPPWRSFLPLYRLAEDGPADRSVPSTGLHHRLRPGGWSTTTLFGSTKTSRTTRNAKPNWRTVFESCPSRIRLGSSGQRATT